MTSRQHITQEAFRAAFAGLVLGRSTLPTKRIERQMLLASVTFGFEYHRIYSEAQVNQLIREWVSRFGAELGVDHVTLRRYLVDEGLLIRDESGASYRLLATSPFFSFDSSIRDLNLEGLIGEAHEERAARKLAHQRKEAHHGDK